MSINRTQLPHFIKGNNFLGEVTADRLNQMSDSIGALQNGYLDNVHGPDVDGRRIEGWRLGIITSTGPEEETDFTDNRYWVKWAVPDDTLDTDDAMTLETDTRMGLQDVVAATNICEAANSHLLPVDDTAYVKVHRIIYPSSRFYFFERIVPRYIHAIIGSNAQDGTNKRWKYAWQEAEKTGAGYGGWTVKTSGRSGTTTTDPAYNNIEDQNGATGTWGNGVDSTNLTGSLTIKPIPSGTRVVLDIVPKVGGGVEYWIVNYANGIDGGCS